MGGKRRRPQGDKLFCPCATQHIAMLARATPLRGVLRFASPLRVPAAARGDVLMASGRGTSVSALRAGSSRLRRVEQGTGDFRGRDGGHWTSPVALRVL